MLKTFEAKNWRCLKNLTVQLPAFGAFIGPNDSGKSTVLGAVLGLANASVGQEITAPHDDPFKLRLVTEAGALQFERSDPGARPMYSTSNPATAMPYAGHLIQVVGTRPMLASIGPATLVRFDPDALRGLSSLVPETEALKFLTERGLGLAGVYQGILARGDEAFSSISASVRALFPTIKTLRVPAVSSSQVILEVELVDGTRVRAPEMSEGLLLYLAYAAIPYVHAVRTLLIEEPETGLHPARIRELLAMLRHFAISTATQVLMSTHSPLVVNELKPSEVIVLTRTAKDGTKAVVLEDTPQFGERSKVYALGELWLSYADGDREAALLDGTSP